MKFLIKIGLIAFAILILAVSSVIFYYYKDLPNIESLKGGKEVQTIQINYANGERITDFGEVYYNEVQFYELPQDLINAVLATEDRKFFEHKGVDFIAIIRAFYANQKAGHIVQGGSTITQQLAKLLFLKPERTFKRKIQELTLAIQLERRLTKEQILTTYLNRAYFGAGNYGVAAAAKYYFGKEISDLSLNEAALLAGLLKAPSKLSPKNNEDSAQARTEVVLNNMIDAGFIDEKDLKNISKQGIKYKTNTLQKLYFADFVNDEYVEFISKNDAQKKNITITTTLDKAVQEKLEDITNQFVKKNTERLGKTQLAVVVMNKEGATLGMIGGKDYQQSQYNRAILAKRPAGSVFKTFIYLAAFESGFSPDDLIEDKKINVGEWLPDNYDNKYLGEVTLKKAFAMSLNSVSVQLAQQIDRSKLINTAKKLGIVMPISKNDLTIALGTTEVSLYELTNAFASIANEGKPAIPHEIYNIKDGEGELLYNHESSGFKEAYSDDTSDYIKEVLRAVVEEGTGRRANVGSNVYGKTGTSQDYRDAWFVGFNDDYVVGVWMGNDDNSPTQNLTGGSLPAELFGQILSKI